MPRGTPPVNASASAISNAGTSNDSNEAPNPESKIIDDRALLWKYVEKMERYGMLEEVGGGNATSASCFITSLTLECDNIY